MSYTKQNPQFAALTDQEVEAAYYAGYGKGETEIQIEIARLISKYITMHRVLTRSAGFVVDNSPLHFEPATPIETFALFQALSYIREEVSSRIHRLSRNG
jgi:hypothetical protein